MPFTPRGAKTRALHTNLALQMQQQAMVELIVGGVLMALVVIGAAWFVLVRANSRGIGAVMPVLGSFMEAGVANDVLRGHALFSNGGIVEYTRDDLAALFDQRDLFDSFQRLQARSFQHLPRREVTRVDQVRLTVDVYYATHEPARMDVLLDREETVGWRIRWIKITRDEQS
jgi:hypothetical protein